MDQKQNIQVSFQKVKSDFNSLKDNMSEWILYLNRKLAEAEYRIQVLEDKAEILENKKFKGVFE